MTTNIYWCQEKDDYSGLFVIAPTRGMAKVVFADEINCKFVDVRTQIYKRGVNEDFCGIIESDSPLLEKYNLKYTEDEE